jgi:predicted aspartyl protease
MCQTRRWVCSFFLLGALLLGRAAPAVADSCRTVAPHPLSDAEKAFIHADYAQAEKFYRGALASEADDPALTAGLVRALLRQQKVSEADTTLKAALTSLPKSAILLTALGEIDYREGLIVESDKASRGAYDADLCYPRAHLLRARLARLNSMYAIEHREIDIAHSLDRYDPEIWSEWIGTLPLPRRIEELRKYLSDSAGADEEDRRRAQAYLDELEKRYAEPRRCRITSGTTSTEIPFEPILSDDGTRTAAWALIVKFNDKGAKLEVDTGASGLYISRAIAEKAGLKPEARSKVYGIGDRGPESGFKAFVDSIRVGNLEFRDCLVEVSDRKNITQSDGLVGMDIFSDFLVSVDFPLHKLELAPLPPRPGEGATPQSLQTEDSGQNPSSNKVAESLTLENSLPGDAKTGSPKPVATGPKDRYIAPEMETWAPVFRINHDLIIPTTLNKKITKLFIIDTGSQFTAVSPQAASEVTRVYNSDLIVRGVSGRVKDVYMTGNMTLQFADKIQDMSDVTALDLSNLSRGMGMEISGLVGSTALKFLTIHIDYRDGLVKFDYDPRRGLNQRQ